MKRRVATLCLFLLAQPAAGEFVVGPSALVGETEDVVIATEVLAEVTFEEPQFPRLAKGREWKRGPASQNQEFWANLDQSSEWAGGELQVLKEIPYSPSQLSRTALEAEVLAELKKN